MISLRMLLYLVALLVSVNATACPTKCTCSNQNTRVSCESRHLMYVPKDIPSEVQYLYLGYNTITKITEADFMGLKNLTELSLKKNTIINISSNAFADNTKLVTIYLTDNFLVALDKEVFKGLVSLQKIYLTNNKLTSVPDMGYAVSLKKLGLDTNKLSTTTDPLFPLGFKQLQRLEQVVLSVNYGIRELRLTDFNSIKDANITKINIARCSINHISNGTFAAFHQLKSLSISYNDIQQNETKGFFQGLAGSVISSLDISGVLRLDQEPVLHKNTFQALTGVPLLTLRMAHSKITVLENGSFKGLSKVTFLDLGYSGIATAEDNAFEGLDSLKTLYLDYNKLSDIPTNLPATLKILMLKQNKIARIPSEVFVNTRDLEKLVLHNNEITQIDNNAFMGADNLKILDLSENNFGGSNLGNNLMNRVSLTELYLQGNKLSVITDAKLFEGTVNLIKLNMSAAECKMLMKGLFQPLQKLQFLWLSSNLLGDQIAADHEGATFAGLRSLTELYLDDNGLRSLPGSIFRDMKSLKRLVLSNNYLYHWGTELFQPLVSLQLVDMSQNEVSTINETSVTYMRPHLLVDLSDNPFSCGCDLVWFRHWLNGTNIDFIHLESYKCASPAKMQSLPILSFNPGNMWATCNWHILLYVSIGFVFVVTMVTAGILYYNRWKIMFYYYFVRQYMKKRQGGNEASLVSETPEYDVLISADEDDSDDKNFVENILLPHIDIDELCNTDNIDAGQEKYKIFYPPKATELGASLPSIFLKYALPDKSRKMIVVLSEAYFRNRAKTDIECPAAITRIGDEGKAAVICIARGGVRTLAAAPSEVKPLFLPGNEPLMWDTSWDHEVTRDNIAVDVFFRNLRERLDKPAGAT